MAIQSPSECYNIIVSLATLCPGAFQRAVGFSIPMVVLG